MSRQHWSGLQHPLPQVVKPSYVAQVQVLVSDGLLMPELQTRPVLPSWSSPKMAAGAQQGVFPSQYSPKLAHVFVTVGGGGVMAGGRLRFGGMVGGFEADWSEGGCWALAFGDGRGTPC